MKKPNDNVKKTHNLKEKSSKMAKNQPKVEYKTLDEVFEIIKSEMTDGKYKSLVAPMNDQNDYKLVVDNDYMVELQQKYSLALDMWSNWYEEYTKELKKVKELDDACKEMSCKNDTLAMENHRLKKKLDIAIRAFEDIRVCSQRDWNEYDCCLCAIKAKKDIEDVK